MGYAIIVGEGALARLAGLPPELLDQVQAGLRMLGDDPTRLARKAVFPFLPRGQVYEFHRDHGGVRYYFAAFFRFGQDERTLQIFDVTVTT